ncbi:TIR domain-containing protein [Xylophilus sp. GOD-11R]|uniref:TIR domain-containing protein n=1 Tax=Xylophilus sp. GOD-11R TaxID=3089814 RepID=UPI00298D3F71|nr:TIR domain-containing protein [Xylophilus sp. GOD-11R]WPB57678.1 TIR domain-containing protein [Xylophilus sp. GOD-11R]
MLKIFLSYASEDRERVRPYFSRLLERGFDPWMDIEKILPGQQWEGAIEKAFREANVIMLFLSPRSVDKRGFVQREANEAIQNLRLKRPDDIYVIPAVLEPCEIPFQIANVLQYVDLNMPNSWLSVMNSLRIAADQQKILVSTGDAHGPFQVFSAELEEDRDGMPGHDIALNYPRVVSAEYPGLALQLSAIFAAWAYETASKARSTPWDQDVENYPPYQPISEDGQPAGELRFPKNGRWSSYSIIHASKSYFSMAFTVSHYFVGAAHSNQHFETANFVIQNGLLFKTALHEFFLVEKDALEVISSVCIARLKKEYWLRVGEAPDNDASEWIAAGCNPSELAHSVPFAAHNAGITFFFAPYSVAAFALGSFAVDVDYYDLRTQLKIGGPFSFASAAEVGTER